MYLESWWVAVGNNVCVGHCKSFQDISGIFRTPAKRLLFLQIPTNMYNEHKMNLALPWWFSYLWQSNVHPFHQGLSLGWRHMLKLHIEWKLYYTMSTLIPSWHVMNSCIRLHRLCGCLFSVYLCTHVLTASFLTNHLGMMRLVSWWLVLVPTCAQIGNSVLLPEYMDYFHLLPRMIS